jgi:hypothetical protein
MEPTIGFPLGPQIATGFLKRQSQFTMRGGTSQFDGFFWIRLTSLTAFFSKLKCLTAFFFQLISLTAFFCQATEFDGFFGGTPKSLTGFLAAGLKV